MGDKDVRQTKAVFQFPQQVHDLTSITYLCDDVLFLYQGRVTENLPVERIGETKDEYARKLLGSIVVFDTEESA